MEHIKNNIYAISDNSPEHLSELGFYCKKDFDGDVYLLRFPVYKYMKRTILECTIMVYPDSKKVKVNVYNCDLKINYMPFYNYDFGDYTIMTDAINRKILSEFGKMGISRCQRK